MCIIMSATRWKKISTIFLTLETRETEFCNKICNIAVNKIVLKVLLNDSYGSASIDFNFAT